MLARGRGCALLMQYEHSKRHMNRRWWVRPWATHRRSQSQGFASNSVQELREEDEGRFHNFFRSLQYNILNITTTRPLCARNFRIFFDKFSLSTRTDEQILQCDNFFLANCTCSKAIMLAFEQVHLSRKKLIKFFFTHQPIKFAQSKLVKQNLLVCNRFKQPTSSF